MNNETKFEEFLQKDGNGYLAFLKRYAVMDEEKLLDRESFYYRQALTLIWATSPMRNVFPPIWTHCLQR